MTMNIKESSNYTEYYNQLISDLQDLNKEEVEEKHRLKTTSCRLFYKGQWVNCETDNIEDNPFELFSCKFY